MSTLQLAWNNAAITQFGNQLTATTFNTGVRVNPVGSQSIFDFFFTGTDTVQVNGGFYGTTGNLIATLMDTSGNVVTGIGTNPITPTIPSTHVFTPQTIALFSGIVPATTYWLRLQYAGNSVCIIESDTLVQLSGTATTPSVSMVTGYNNAQIYAPSSTFTGPTNVAAILGFEGQMRIDSVASETCYASGILHAGGNGWSGGKIRFKASCTEIWVRQYGNAANILRLQTVALNGSSGVPTQQAVLNNAGSGASLYGAWVLLASGLSSASALYEIVVQANSSGGSLISGIMTSGGTGIDLTTTTAGLTRSYFLNTIGDSIVAQDYPVGNLCWLLESEGISQTENAIVLNVGVDGIALSGIVASLSAYVAILTASPVPSQGVMIRCGINDIKSGSPPSVATLSGYMGQLINAIRAVGGGWATCKINVEGILPSNTETYAYTNQYNKGAGGYQSLVAEYNAGTAPSQSPSPDPNVYYRDVDTMQLGGSAYPTGGAFNGANYVDGLHPNTTGGAIIQAFELAYFSGTGYALIGPSTGQINVASTNFTVTPNGSVTDTVTPASTGAGTFSPTSLTFSNSNTAQTFTYTPTSVTGSPHQISITSANSLTVPSALSYAVTEPPLVASVLTLGAPTNTSIAFTGTASTGGLAPYSYQAQTSPHGANTWTNNGSASSTVPTSVTGLTASTDYDVRVVTTDSQGTPATANSNVISSFTASSGGGTALTLTITKPSGQPVLTWTADSLATSYNVLRATALSGPYTRIANPASGTLTYTDTTEPAGTIQYAVTSNH